MSIAKKSLGNFLGRLAGQLFAIGGAVAIARTLGPEGKGLFAYASTLLTIVLMANSGQASAISWQIAKRKRAPRALLRAMLRVLAYAAFPLTAGLVIAGIAVPGQSVLLAVAAALPLAVYVQSATGFFLVNGDVMAINIQQLILNCGVVALYVPLLLLARGGLGVVLVSWIVSYGAAAVYTIFALRSHTVKTEGDADGSIVREQLGYAAQTSVNSVVQYLNFRVDALIVMFMLGKSALGIYSIGLGIGEMLWQLSRPITTASFSQIAAGDERQSAHAAATAMRHSLALVLLASLVVYFALPPLIPILYGARFAQAGLVARLLLPGIIAYSLMPTLATYFSQQLGNPRIPLIFSSISTAICAAVTIILLPRIGILGGAVATSISYMTAFALAAWYFARRTKLRPRQLFVLSLADLHPYRRLFTEMRLLLSR